MYFFLGAETIAPASGKWQIVSRIVEPRLKLLQDFTYGAGLNRIAIISIILPDTFYEEGGYRERRLYKKSRQEADSRLRLDYYSFINANDNQRLRIYTEHVLSSIKTLERKIDRSFDFTKLMEDVNDRLADFL